jgi:hypothetical protein
MSNGARVKPELWATEPEMLHHVFVLILVLVQVTFS